MTDSELTDVGGQAERTALGWQRTEIGMMAVGALLMRWDITEHLPMWPGIVLTASAGLSVLILVPDRYRRVLRTVRAGYTPLSRRMVPSATLLMVLVILGVGVELAVRLTG
jgi:uncharacterized membrane protein YidH (DUF202 family)